MAVPIMTPTWNDLANSARWRGVVFFIRNWVGPFSSEQGMAHHELEEILRAKSLKLPAAVREWYLLAGNWNEGGLNVWIRPQALAACAGMIWILTDTEGINQWGVRVADGDAEDPPVYSVYANPGETEFPSFSTFVAGMVVNDVLVDYETEAPVELNRDSSRAELTFFVASRCGEFLADAPLETATIVAFAYPGDGPVLGKARTPTGRERLQRFRAQSV